MGEQAMADALPLMMGHNKKLLDTQGLVLRAERDVAGQRAVDPGHEDGVALERLESPLVVPAAVRPEDRLCECEELAPLLAHARLDVDLRRHRQGRVDDLLL